MDRKKLKAELHEAGWKVRREECPHGADTNPENGCLECLAAKVESLIAEETGRLRARQLTDCLCNCHEQPDNPMFPSEHENCKLCAQELIKEAVELAREELEGIEYKTEDLVLPILQLPNPLPIKITMDGESLRLYVGPRDFQFSRKTGECVGAGVGVCESCVDTTPERPKLLRNSAGKSDAALEEK